jgi:hypothetical protein
MNYRIIGADGKTYGPVGLEQIRQWLAQGRVDSRTPVHVEGAVAWTSVGLLPELAAAFAPTPPTIAALAPAAGQPRRTNGFATAGLVCSLLSWVCCCCVPLNLLAVIFCIIALVQINGQAQPQEGRAFAIIGLVLSGLSLLLSFAGALVQLVLNPALNWPVQFQ